jgi:hypothetical protein
MTQTKNAQPKPSRTKPKNEKLNPKFQSISQPENILLTA